MAACVYLLSKSNSLADQRERGLILTAQCSESRIQLNRLCCLSWPGLGRWVSRQGSAPWWLTYVESKPLLSWVCLHNSLRAVSYPRFCVVIIRMCFTQYSMGQSIVSGTEVMAALAYGNLTGCRVSKGPYSECSQGDLDMGLEGHRYENSTPGSSGSSSLCPSLFHSPDPVFLLLLF